MMWNRYIRIMVILGMVAVMCGAVSAATGIVAQTQAMSVGAYPACTEPCECITENNAAIRWGAEGYEKCSKSICGQDANGNIQYYCIHKIGSTVSASTAVSTVTGATTAVATPVPEAVSQETVNAPVTSAAITATPSSTRQATVAITLKTPVEIATILGAIGAALLAAAGTRRK
ncbi:MAG: hypothetical protein WCB46_00130 [Methanoregula sp.]